MVAVSRPTAVSTARLIDKPSRLSNLFPKIYLLSHAHWCLQCNPLTNSNVSMTIIMGAILPKRWLILGIKKQVHGSYKSLCLSSSTTPEHFSLTFLGSTASEPIYVLCVCFRSLTWLPIAPLPLLAAATECLFALWQSEAHLCCSNQRLWSTLLLIKWTNDLHNICLWGRKHKLTNSMKTNRLFGSSQICSGRSSDGRVLIYHARGPGFDPTASTAETVLGTPERHLSSQYSRGGGREGAQEFKIILTRSQFLFSQSGQ